MKNKSLVCAFLFGVLLAFQSQAGVIQIQTTADPLSVEDRVVVELVASNFSEFDLFDLDFIFDSSIFSFEPASLFSDLASAFIFEVNASGNRLSISFLDWAAMSGDFLLARFELKALKNGSSALSIGQADFYAPGSSDVMAGIQSNSVQLNVGAAAVPAPAAIVLMLSGLLLLLCRSQRRQL